MTRTIAIVGGVLLCAQAATAQSVYDNLDSGTDGVAFFGDIVLDDLAVAASGRELITSVTVAITTSPDGPAQTSDLSLLLARDGGDGFPDVTGTGDDTFIVQAYHPPLTVQPGEIVEITFDVSDQYATVNAKTLLFGGIQFSNPLVSHAFYGAPTVGSTNEVVFSLFGGGPVTVPGVEDPALTGSMGLAFRIESTRLAESIGGAVVGPVIDFDDLEESFLGTSVSLGGATFQNGWDSFAPPVPATFAADDGTGVWDLNPDMLDFVGGTCLNLNGWSGGPDGYLFTIMRRIEIVPDTVHTGAALSVNYVADGDPDYRRSEITLLAKRNGDIVGSNTVRADNELGVSGGGTFTFGASRLRIAGVEFDELVLFVNGGAPGASATLGGIDNVVLGSAVAGDIDGDGLVAVSDLLAILSAWGDCPALCPEDVDGDGTVGVGDLLVVLGGWT